MHAVPDGGQEGDRRREGQIDLMSADYTDSPNQSRDRIWELTGAPADIHIDTGTLDGSTARRAEAIVHAEVSRIDRVFSIDDDTSIPNRLCDSPPVPST